MSSFLIPTHLIKTNNKWNCLWGVENGLKSQGQCQIQTHHYVKHIRDVSCTYKWKNRVYSYLPFLFICNFPLWQWETWLLSTINSFTVQLPHTCKAVSELTHTTPWETNFPTWAQCLCTIPSVFSLTISRQNIIFQSHSFHYE